MFLWKNSAYGYQYIYFQTSQVLDELLYILRWTHSEPFACAGAPGISQHKSY